MKIGAVLHVVDFEGSVAFYRDVIGLKLADVEPGAGYQPIVDFAYLESKSKT